jgi:hypothetical protein
MRHCHRKQTARHGIDGAIGGGFGRITTDDQRLAIVETGITTRWRGLKLPLEPADLNNDQAREIVHGEGVDGHCPHTAPSTRCLHGRPIVTATVGKPRVATALAGDVAADFNHADFVPEG